MGKKSSKQKKEARKALRAARQKETLSVEATFVKLAKHYVLGQHYRDVQLIQLEKRAGIVIEVGGPYTNPYWRKLRLFAVLCPKAGVDLPRILWETKDKLLEFTPVSPLRDALKRYEVLDAPEEPTRPPAGKQGKKLLAAEKAARASSEEAQNEVLSRFYRSFHWRKVRYEALLLSKGCCMACKRTNLPLHVDHIKPLRKYWKLRLEIDNLQVLCAECNHGKGNWDETDWRAPPPKPKIKRIRL